MFSSADEGAVPTSAGKILQYMPEQRWQQKQREK